MDLLALRSVEEIVEVDIFELPVEVLKFSSLDRIFQRVVEQYLVALVDKVMEETCQKLCELLYHTKILTITEPCSNREFPREGAENLPFTQNLRISSWSYDMEGHAKKCVERYCQLANKTTQQPYKVSTPFIDNHH